MASGFPPKYSEDFVQLYITPTQFLMLCLYTAQELGWEVNYLSNSGIIAYTQNGLFKFNAELKVIINGHNASLVSSSTGREIFDLGKNKKVVQQFKAKFEEVKKQYAYQVLDENYEAIREQIIADSQDILKLPEPTGLDIFKDFLSIFKPSTHYFFTPILLNLNILVFLAMAFTGVDLMAPDVDSLLQWGANYKPLTLEGQWWRLITCCFVHIGVLHLLMNMYALLYIGILLEPILGKSRFLVAYLATGVIASLASLWWHDISVSAGASGAIFGMYGVFLALLTTSIVEKSTRKPLFISIAIFVVYNLMSGIKEGIDNAAHIGGILSGVFIGYLFLPSLKNTEAKNLKQISLIFLILGTVILSYFVLHKLPNNVGAYDKIMAKVYVNDTLALSIYKIPDTTAKEIKLQKIESIAIAKTSENTDLIKEAEKLDLPPYLKYNTTLFKKIFDLRLASFKLYYQAVNEETNQYDTELQNYYAQLDSMQKQIN